VSCGLQIGHGQNVDFARTALTLTRSVREGERFTAVFFSDGHGVGRMGHRLA
jgi:hypothetical protein